jgi:hypothetical protein
VGVLLADFLFHLCSCLVVVFGIGDDEVGGMLVWCCDAGVVLDLAAGGVVDIV